MKKEKIRNIINVFAILYALCIAFIIIPMSNFFLLSFNLLILIVLILISFFLEQNINTIPEIFSYSMDNANLENLLKENLRKEKYKYVNETLDDVKKSIIKRVLLLVQCLFVKK